LHVRAGGMENLSRAAITFVTSDPYEIDLPADVDEIDLPQQDVSASVETVSDDTDDLIEAGLERSDHFQVNDLCEASCPPPIPHGLADASTARPSRSALDVSVCSVDGSMSTSASSSSPPSSPKKKRVVFDLPASTGDSSSAQECQRRVLVVGELHGRLRQLHALLDRLSEQRQLPDFVLACGRFMANTQELSDYTGRTPQKTLPAPVYFVDSADQALIEQSKKAAGTPLRLSEKIIFLGAFGVCEIDGIRVAFLSGSYDKACFNDGSSGVFHRTHYTRHAYDELVRQVSENGRRVDIFLTSEWPDLEWSAVRQQLLPPVDAGRTSLPVRRLFFSMKPRYHVYTGGSGLYRQQEPQGPKGSFAASSVALAEVAVTDQGSEDDPFQRWWQTLLVDLDKSIRTRRGIRILPAKTGTSAEHKSRSSRRKSPRPASKAAPPPEAQKSAEEASSAAHKKRARIGESANDDVVVVQQAQSCGSRLLAPLLSSPSAKARGTTRPPALRQPDVMVVPGNAPLAASARRGPHTFARRSAHHRPSGRRGGTTGQPSAHMR